MDNVDNQDGLTSLRTGRVLDMHALRDELSAVDVTGDIVGYGIVFFVPAIVLDELGPVGSRHVEPRLDVLPASGSDEQVAVLTAQAGGTQLRVVMPLGDLSVQHYLLDCMQRGRLRLLLGDDARTRLVVVDIPGGFHAHELVRRLLRESLGKVPDAQTLMELGRVLRPLDSVEPLIPGHAVTSAVTVLVSNGELEAGLRAGSGFPSRPKTSLH